MRHVAPAIAAAGLVLASSFATLLLASDPGTRETGFTLALGILLASLLVSSVLVPALTALVGRWAARVRPSRYAPAPGAGRADQRRESPVVSAERGICARDR